ncbi:MAG: Gp15 family bacteriophage protein [Oscillospiraceae bacterium]
MASFQSMYGIRLSRELSGMKWREFCSLLSGLSADTPLGHIVSVRAENDPKRLKEFTPEMKRVRAKWRTRKAKAMPQEKVDDFVESMRKAFIAMA